MGADIGENRFKCGALFRVIAFNRRRIGEGPVKFSRRLAVARSPSCSTHTTWNRSDIAEGLQVTITCGVAIAPATIPTTFAASSFGDSQDSSLAFLLSAPGTFSAAAFGTLVARATFGALVASTFGTVFATFLVATTIPVAAASRSGVVT